MAKRKRRRVPPHGWPIPPKQRPPLTGWAARWDWMRRKMVWQRLFAAALGAGLLVYGVVTLGTELSVSANPGEAVAEVVDVQGSRGPDTYTVEFSVGNRQVRADIEDGGYEVGDEVLVQYDRDHPTRARFKGSHGQVVAGVLFGGVGLVLAYGVFKPQVVFSRW